MLSHVTTSPSASTRHAHLRRRVLTHRVEVEWEHTVLPEHHRRPRPGQNSRQRVECETRDGLVHGDRAPERARNEPRHFERDLFRGRAGAAFVPHAQRHRIAARREAHELLPDHALVGARRFAESWHPNRLVGLDRPHHRGTAAELQARRVRGDVAITLALERQNTRRQRHCHQRQRAVGLCGAQKRHARHEGHTAGATDQPHRPIDALHLARQRGLTTRDTARRRRACCRARCGSTRARGKRHTRQQRERDVRSLLAQTVQPHAHGTILQVEGADGDTSRVVHTPACVPRVCRSCAAGMQCTRATHEEHMRGACARHIAWRMMTACSTYVTRDWLAATVGRRYVRPVPIEDASRDDARRIYGSREGGRRRHLNGVPRRASPARHRCAQGAARKAPA